MNNNDSDRTKSVAQMVRETIHMRPSLLDALKMQIVNYSALARMLQTEIGEGSLEAVKAAIIRVSDELETENSLREEMVLSILRESVVRLQDKISVIISSEELDIPYIVHVQVSSNLVALILISPPRVEDTPGFVAFITSLLASREINIVEFISCSTNTVIILDQADALNAFSLLQNYI